MCSPLLVALVDTIGLMKIRCGKQALHRIRYFKSSVMN